MIKDKKEKQSTGGSSGSSASTANSNNTKNSNNGNNNIASGNSASSSSPSSSKSNKNNHPGSSNSSSSNKSNLSIKEEVIEQGSSEQLIVTSIKHEDGSPPSTIIKKELATSLATPSNSGPSTSSNVNSNDSNNNNDTNDNKNSNSSGNPLLPDDKDSVNDNNITDELLNSDDINSSGSGNNSNKLGLHIKNEEPAIDPLAVESNNNNFGTGNPSGQNRSLIPQSSPDRIQPLPSNVVNKQSNSSMDYMQQQSQIFVFSTALANKGAEAVRSGQFPTIIAYHCAQPETKKFLQKFPLKVNQFNRSGWFPNMTSNISNNKKSRMMPMNQPNYNFIKNTLMNNPAPNGPISNQMGMQSGFPSSCDMNNPEGNTMWNQGNQHQINLDPLGNNGPSLDPLLNDTIDSLDPLVSNSQTNQMNDSHQSPMGGNMCMDPTSPSIPSLQGVKVPDEDLTPQQRSQRAMKLAQLQNIKQMFKQEPPLNPNECQMNEQDVSGNGPCSKMNSNSINPMMQTGMMPSSNTLGPHNPMNGPMRPNFPMGPRGNMCRPMGPNSLGPGMNPNAINEEMMSGMGSSMGGPMNAANMQMGSGGAIMGNMNMPPHMQGGNIGMNNMGNCNMNMNINNMNSGGPNMGMIGQKGMPPQMMSGPPGQAHMEWNKLQQQYYDENKRKGQMCGPMEINSDPSMCSGMGPGMNRQMPPGTMRNMPNMRGPGGQGPPPPYHQTPRSASVPIATQSPNPNSPNNPTSNLSLPSPRGSCNSTLNSPAGGDHTRSLNTQHMNMKHMNPRQSPTTSSQDSPAGTLGRQINHSNPSTPISSHLSPSASLKDLEMSNNPNKEPNLMPVPSPQQISYLNTFESQELTIQKQPNTNIKDGSNIGPNQANLNLDNRLPGQKTPTSSANSHMNNFPIPSSPHTPGSSIQGEKNRINPSGPSPQNSIHRTNSMMSNDLSQFPSHQHPNNQQQSNESNMQFPSDTPNMPFGPNSQQQNKMGNFMDQKPGDMGNNGPPSQFAPCSGRPDLPLNPNSNATMSNTKPSHFDPISSLAQMSQQLTTAGVPGSLNGQPMMSGFNNNGMMNEMGGQMNMGPDGQLGGQMEFGGMVPGMGSNQYGGPRSMSPKIGGPQMGPGFPGPGMPNMRMARPMGYNGTNIQVKPNAPNTIQYLPARPQMNNSNPPRGPPSLDFLQRFTNPMGMEEMNKGGPVVNQQNMPYFPNQNNPGCGMGQGMDPIDGSVNSMAPGNGPPMGMMNQNPMMMRGMRGNGGNIMRFQGPTGGNNPCMMGNNSFSNSSNNSNMVGDHQMMFSGPGVPQNPQMFVSGPKGSPMSGPPNPEQMQMMGGPGNGPPHFKQQAQQQQSHFPSTADPNYAQQYHNFQQQLYATNNNQRNQMGMGGNQAFMPK